MYHFTKKEHWINIKLENAENVGKISIYNIYSPNHYRDKEKSWKTLKDSKMEDHEGNIIVGGDLNLIIKEEEKIGGNFMPNPSREALEEIIE